MFGRPERRRWRVVEDPDRLGYHLVCDPLLDLMDADEWYALEQAAVARGSEDAEPR